MLWLLKADLWLNTYENTANPSLTSVLMTLVKCVFVPRIGFRRTRTQFAAADGTQ
jgi:hypothetical protein